MNVQSQRDCVFQTRVASLRATLGKQRNVSTTPTGLRLVSWCGHLPSGCNPFVVVFLSTRLSQGSSSVATLGFEIESRWDSRSRQLTIKGPPTARERRSFL